VVAVLDPAMTRSQESALVGVGARDASFARLLDPESDASARQGEG
jgi:hypothetical protein